MANHLYYGDNLHVLREHVKDESVDLIYLDPPFNSAATYNVLFRAPTGEQSQAQIEAFEDTWHWTTEPGGAADAFDQVMKGGNADAAELLRAMRSFLKENDMMAYLAMMAVRLLELHRVLKPTGSLYLHCDPTAGHYLKLLLDAVFGPANFRNEIVWKRQSAHSDARHKFSDVSDLIFFFAKSEVARFEPQYAEHDPDYIEKFYRFDDKDGRGLYRLGDMASPNPRPLMMYEWMGFPWPQKGWRYQRETMQQLHDEGRIYYPRNSTGELDTTRRPALKRYLNEQKGSIVTNVWTDIPPLHSSNQERLGYPTQKPVALLERIISASSNEGDVVLDPFCGCGTTIHAAQKLNRHWIGIDLTHLAIRLVERRLRESFGNKVQFETHGVPKDLDGARALAEKNKFEFERWAVTLIPDAQPYKSKGGGDTGIDGVLYFKLGKKDTAKAILSVKGGKNVNPAMVRDLKGTTEREKAGIGLFITLAEPSKQMTAEGASAGFFEHDGKKYPKIQILTIEDLLDGKRPQVPLIDSSVYKKAAREDDSETRQGDLEL